MADNNGAHGPLPAWARRVAGEHDRALIATIAHIGAAHRHFARAATFRLTAVAVARVIAATGPILDALMIPAVARDLLDRAHFDREHGTDYATRDFPDSSPEDDDAQA